MTSTIGGRADAATRSLWLEHAGDIGMVRPSLDDDMTVDIVIVGGAITGGLGCTS